MGVQNDYIGFEPTNIACPGTPSQINSRMAASCASPTSYTAESVAYARHIPVSRARRVMVLILAMSLAGDEASSLGRGCIESLAQLVNFYEGPARRTRNSTDNGGVTGTCGQCHDRCCIT